MSVGLNRLITVQVRVWVVNLVVKLGVRLASVARRLTVVSGLLVLSVVLFCRSSRLSVVEFECDYVCLTLDRVCT